MASPGPPSSSGKGYQVRLYHQILGLAKRHEVELVTFSPSGDLDQAVAASCVRVKTVPWSTASAGRSALIHGAQLPLSVALFRTGAMAQALSDAVSRRPDVVQLQLTRMAPYLDELSGVPAILDLLDASALSMRERARAANPMSRPLLGVEAARLATYEKKAIARADLALLISRRDFQYAGSPANGRIVPNGIEPVEDSTAAAHRNTKTVIFSGTMSYFPNADAAIWFAREMMPLVRDTVPEATFRVVGREPTPAVKSLAQLPGVIVTGPVGRISAEIASATVSVCPMRFGSGTQTKILEAIAAGTPVVATSKGLEGIPDDLHRFIHRADSATELATATALILKDPGPALELASEGLLAITREHTWARHVDELERLYEETIRAGATARRSR